RYCRSAPVKLVGRVQRVGGCGRGVHYDTGPAHGSDRSDDVVGAAGNAPTQSHRLSRTHAGRISGEDRDSGRRTRGYVSRSVDRSLLYYFKVGRGNRFEQIQVCVVPAIVGSSADENGAAIVGENHAVFLQSGQDHLIVGRKSRDIETGF